MSLSEANITQFMAHNSKPNHEKSSVIESKYLNTGNCETTMMPTSEQLMNELRHLNVNLNCCNVSSVSGFQ